MAILSKEQILAADDLERETVSVPEWGGEVIVRSLTAMERSQYQMSLIEMGKDGKTKAMKLEAADIRLAALTIIGEDGERYFSLQEVAALGKKSGKALNRVVEAAQRLNAMTEEDIEELVGNSEEAPIFSSATS